jgi:hypothetical protein
MSKEPVQGLGFAGLGCAAVVLYLALIQIV